MIAVVISHNQKESIQKMRDAIDVPVLFVLDRCTDGSQEECKRLGIDFITNEIGTGRQVSRSRNIGAAKFPNDDILFLDGDRVPLFPVSWLDRSSFSVTLVKCQEDVRDRISRKSWESEPLWGTYHNGLFSSCVLIRRRYIDLVIEEYGHLFDEEFTEWGEEDRHLGDLLFSVGASCCFADDSWRVSGRATLNEERAEEFQNMTKLRISKLFKLGLENLMYDPSQNLIFNERRIVDMENRQGTTTQDIRVRNQTLASSIVTQVDLSVLQLVEAVNGLCAEIDKREAEKKELEAQLTVTQDRVKDMETRLAIAEEQAKALHESETILWARIAEFENKKTPMTIADANSAQSVDASCQENHPEQEA